MADQETKRVNVNFSSTSYEALQELAESKNTTMSDVLRDALALEKWFDDVQKEGGRVLVERDDELREVVPR